MNKFLPTIMCLLGSIGLSFWINGAVNGIDELEYIGLAAVTTWICLVSLTVFKEDRI